MVARIDPEIAPLTAGLRQFFRTGDGNTAVFRKNLFISSISTGIDFL
jgi:hypothetical protein